MLNWVEICESIQSIMGWVEISFYKFQYGLIFDLARPDWIRCELDWLTNPQIKGHANDFY